MGARSSNRKKWRMPCEIRADGVRQAGFVLDLSASGLFIQTGAKTRPGQRLEISLSLPSGEVANLGVRVARAKRVPPRLLTVAQGGIGVRIDEATPNFDAFLDGLGIERRARGGSAGGGGSEADAAGETDTEPKDSRFRVRISQVSGPRSRRIDVEAPDADAAHAAALEAAGPGWKVLDVDPA